MVYILIVFIISILYLFRDRKIEVTEPSYLYSIIWFSIIFIYLLDIIGILSPLKPAFYWVFITTYMMFIFGCIMGKKIRRVKRNYLYSKSRLYFFYKILFVLIFLSFILTIQKLGLPPLLSGVNRQDYYIGYLEIIYLSIYVFWFIGFFLIKEKYKPRRVILLILITLLIVILKGNKFPIIYLICLSIYSKTKEKEIRVKQIIGYIFLILVIFIGAMTLYVENFQFYIPYKVGLVDFKLSSSLWFLIDPLLYLTSNFMNLSNFIVLEITHDFGLHMTRGLLSLARIDGLFENTYNLSEELWKQSLVYPWLTTGTYLKEIYLDFGHIGLLLFPFFFGAFSGNYYKLTNGASYKPSIVQNYISFILFYSICISFFSFYFNNIELITNLILICIIHFFSVINSEKT